MKHLLLILSACLYGMAATADTGVPFFRNYTAAEYGAHNRNFDVATGPCGIVFFANFEGVLYYDNDQWRILRTPGYARATCLLKDSRGTIWVGGYNFAAKIMPGLKRDFTLQPIPTGNNKIGEVTAMTEKGGKVYLLNRAGQAFMINGGILMPADKDSFRTQARLSPVKWSVDGTGAMEINEAITMRCGWTALATQRQGLVVLDGKGRKIYNMGESDGLCSNSVNKIAEDGYGSVWGVTDNGIFRAYLPTMFTQYTAAQGLKGEVTTIARCNGKLYIGTLQGLYVEKEERLHAIRGINHACWKLQPSPDGKALYAATTEGVYRVQGHAANRLTDEYAQTLCCDGTSLYAAGMDGISQMELGTGAWRKIAALDHVTELSCDTEGNVTAKDIDGRIYRKNKESHTFKPAGKVRADLRLLTATDGTQWATDIEGKNIIRVTDGNSTGRMNERLKPIGGKTVRTIYEDGDSVLWAGGDFGVVRVDFHADDATYGQPPRAYFRQVTIDGDSLLFGGAYAKEEPTDGKATPTLGSHIHEITFRFSADAAPAQGETTYQYMLEGYDKGWSGWSRNTSKSYANLSHGTYTFKVRARDAFGRCSGTIAYRFAIERPYYLQWYSLLAYLLTLLSVVWLAVKWRLRGLIKDKERLERTVASRTMQIQEQKDEIEKKSANLEQALTDLRHAQEDLLRQEKLATVGKLTRGLIDRILNPLNYINNFSHLSLGLTKELRQDLEARKGLMDSEEYEDTDDLLKMLSSNLAKIELHGGNTSRILKAMEEILKEHNRAKERMDLSALCRRSADLIHEYYRNEMAQMGITVDMAIPDKETWIEGNEEQLGKILMSLVSNSMYAIGRKYRKQAYAPRIILALATDGHEAEIRLKDNGTGIGTNIMGQVFDPFFTTKTTGEAAGVGLYLSREIIIDHGGEIRVASVPGEYTEFTITLPIYKIKEHE